MIKPRLSIIVPVYNVEKYLRKCVDSILQQYFTDFELILVNDGSKDNSEAICTIYAEADHRVHLISQKNGGVSSARNAGIEVATGEWIGFIDADDYIDPDFYKKMMDATEETQAEIICCGVRAVNEAGEEQPHLQCDVIPSENTLFTKEQALYHFLHPSHRFLFWSPWDKIIKADIAKKNKFETGRRYAEDFYFCFQCMTMASGVYYIPDKKYNYFLRPGSAIRSGSFEESAFDTFYFAGKVFRHPALNTPVLRKTGEMNLLIIAARTVRSYYQLSDGKDERLKEKTVVLRKAIKKGNREVIRSMKKSHRILMLEAAYLPFLFKIR